MVYKKVFWHVRYKAPEMLQETGRLAFAHLLERKKLQDALLSRGVQPPHELGPQCGVGVSFGWEGDNVLHFFGVPVIQLPKSRGRICSSRC
jgi:hypothetical protein